MSRGTRHLSVTLVISGLLAVVAIGALALALKARGDERVSEAEIEDQWAQYDFAVQSCDRDNQLRIDLNSVIAAIQGVNQLLVEFFDSSAAFRSAENRDGLAAESIEARDTIKEFAENARYLPLVACNLVWPFPNHPRPH